jgi:hypothetical protein
MLRLARQTASRRRIEASNLLVLWGAAEDTFEGKPMTEIVRFLRTSATDAKLLKDKARPKFCALSVCSSGNPP